MFRKTSGFRVFESRVPGDEPMQPALEMGWMYINVPDKKLWVVAFNESTRLLEATLLVTPAPSVESVSLDPFRIVVRSGALCIDQAITETGFEGDESLDEGATGDWINLNSYKHA